MVMVIRIAEYGLLPNRRRIVAHPTRHMYERAPVLLETMMVSRLYPLHHAATWHYIWSRLASPPISRPYQVPHLF